MTLTRKQAKQELTRLLRYWREIEFWIKRAENVRQEAVIPAINELRYASRQLFNAVRVYSETRALTDGDGHILQKRLCLAEQYLINADHDITDAIISIADELFVHIEQEFSIGEFVPFFPDYFSAKELVRECLKESEETRHNYDLRQEKYESIRKKLEIIILYIKKMEEAMFQARSNKKNLEYSLSIAQKRGLFFERASFALALLSVALAIAALA